MIKHECKKCGKRVYTGTIKIENGEQIFVCSHCEEKEEQLSAEQQQVYPTLTESNWGLEIVRMAEKIEELERELKRIKMPTNPNLHWWEMPMEPTCVPTSTPINLQRDGSLRNM